VVRTYAALFAAAGLDPKVPSSSTVIKVVASNNTSGLPNPD